MPAPSKPAEQSSTSVAQSRFTVALPREVGDDIDKLGAKLSDAVFAASGLRIEISRPDVIKAIVKTALAVQTEDSAETA